MSAAKPEKTFPTWRGMIARPDWGSGSDVMKGNDSAIAAKIADTIIYREMMKDTITLDELPMCWSASFRGALRGLNQKLWQLQLLHASN